MLYVVLFVIFASIIGVARWLRRERRAKKSAPRVRCRLGRERVEAVVVGVVGKRHFRVRFSGWRGREQVRARSALTFV